MVFKHELMTDQAISIIEVAFKKSKNNNIHALRSTRINALDTKRSKGWVFNTETNDFLIQGIPVSMSSSSFYYFYFKGKLFNLLIDRNFFEKKWRLEYIDNVAVTKAENITQDFLEVLADAMLVLESDLIT